MDIKCTGCGAINRINSNEKKTHHCKSCGKSLPNEKKSTTVESMYIVCAFCHKGFYASAHAESQSSVCPSCGKEVKLSLGAETITMAANDASDFFMVDQPPHPGPAYTRPKSAVDTQSAVSFGGYIIKSLCNSTAVGNVYEGEQINLKRAVTIYVLSEELSQKRENVEMFMNEARKSAVMIHPNIARVYDIGEEDGRCYMVSELTSGKSVEEHVKDDDLFNFAETAKIGAQAARALAEAHKHDILHCWLRPGDVIINSKNELKIMHFGISRVLFDKMKKQPLNDSANFFFAPELLLSQEPGEKSDLFSLGVLLYCGLTGSMPYNSTEIIQLKSGKGVPVTPDIQRLFPDIPADLASIIKQLLNIRPANRPSSASEVAVQLEALYESLSKNPKKESGIRQNIMSPQRKRLYKRLPVEMDVSMKPEKVDKKKEAEYLTKLKNLSENGAFVLTDNPPEIGSFVRLEFVLEGSNNKVNVLGVVRWRDMSPGSVGMGIQFIEVSTKNKNKLSTYVDRKTADETLQVIGKSAMHKTILRQLVKHYGERVPITTIMKSTGTSRMLFNRTIEDFVKLGLVSIEKDELVCQQPASDSMRIAIERMLNISH